MASVEELVEKAIRREHTSELLDPSYTACQGYEPHLVKSGMQRELDNLLHFKAFSWVKKNTLAKGVKLLTMRWVLKAKGPEEVRARLALRQYAGYDSREDFFAPTPSPTAVRILIAYHRPCEHPNWKYNDSVYAR